MKRMKKLIALLVAVALVVSMSMLAMATEDTGFSDVKANAWYADAVKYCQENGLMSGTTTTTFAPNATISRAMLATILYRQAGSPAVTQAADFSDVSANRWYGNAVSWVADSGIVSGYSDGHFGPNDPVSREQMATILWRAKGSPAAGQAAGATGTSQAAGGAGTSQAAGATGADQTGQATGATGTTAAFADQSSVASYAAEAVAWAHANVIISGREGNQFAPKGMVTRAEAAVMLQRYLNLDQQNAAQTPAPKTPAKGETAITITIGDTVIPATLNDSVSAQDLISRLPLTVSMTRGSADYYASLNDPLNFAPADVHNGWHNGDIGFDSGGNYLTIFHDGEDTSQEYGNQVTLGQVGDLALLDDLGSSVQATFALAQVGRNDSSEHKTLVVYYSHTQRTKGVAEALQKKVDGDIYELVPAKPYTGSDGEISDRATEEIASGNLPAFSGSLPDLSKYDTILVGGPVWNYTVSAPILSYLNQTDFTGKTVAPFWTDQGGPGTYEKDFTAATKNAKTISEFLQLSHVPSISAEDLNRRLDAWIEDVLK